MAIEVEGHVTEGKMCNFLFWKLLLDGWTNFLQTGYEGIPGLEIVRSRPQKWRSKVRDHLWRVRGQSSNWVNAFFGYNSKKKLHWHEASHTFNRWEQVYQNGNCNDNRSQRSRDKRSTVHFLSQNLLIFGWTDFVVSQRVSRRPPVANVGQWQRCRAIFPYLLGLLVCESTFDFVFTLNDKCTSDEICNSLECPLVYFVMYY